MELLIKKGFCEECREDMLFTIKTDIESFEMHGRKLYYEKTIAVCRYCNTELFVPELNSKNLLKMYDAIYQAFPPTQEDIERAIKFDLTEFEAQSLINKYFPGLLLAQA